MAPTSVSTTDLSRMRGPGNSSGMSVSVAPAALPMPIARCPAPRPIVMTRYQRDVVDVALHDPLEPVAHAEHVDGLEPCPDSGRPDDAVDARRRPATDQDRQCSTLGHRRVP